MEVVALMIIIVIIVVYCFDIITFIIVFFIIFFLANSNFWTNIYADKTVDSCIKAFPLLKDCKLWNQQCITLIVMQHSGFSIYEPFINDVFRIVEAYIFSFWLLCLLVDILCTPGAIGLESSRWRGRGVRVEPTLMNFLLSI